MHELQSFTAIALATTWPPMNSHGHQPSLIVTGVGFLAVTAEKGGISFDLATRVIPDDRSEFRLLQWIQANVPEGLRAGLHLDRYDDFEPLPTASIVALHQPTRFKSRITLVELEVWSSGWPSTLREACAEFGFPTGEREQAQKGDASKRSSTILVEQALTLDTIATARLAVALAARELRGGDALRDQFEEALLGWVRDSGVPGAEPHLRPCVPEPPAPSDEPEAQPHAQADPNLTEADDDTPLGSPRNERLFL